MARIVIDVVANAAKAKAELRSLEGAAAGISGRFASFRAPAAAALAAVGVGSFTAVRAASDLNETVSKARAIFGEQAAAIESWAGTAASKLGLSRAAALDAAAGFGDLFSQLGFSGKQAADMSASVVGLSADLGSFNNLPTADVSERIAAAFRGEYDSLQALIPNINAARVESEALTATGKKAAKELTAQERATAVLAIVQKDGARAVGDFARTQEGAANQTKVAQAQAADLAANLGQKLLPAYVAVLGAANSFLGFLGQNQGAVAGVVAGIAALAAILLVASAATTIYNGALAVARIASVAYTAAQWLLNAALTANPIGIIVVAIALLVAGLVLAWRNSETFRKVVTAAFQAVARVAQVVWAAVKVAAQVAWAFITAYVRMQIAIVRAIITAVRVFIVAAWNAIKVAWAQVVNSIRSLFNGLKSLLIAGWNAIKSGATKAWNAIKSAVTGAINSARDKFNSLKSVASGVISRIRSLFSPSALVNAGRQLIAGLASGIRDKIESAVAAVRAGVQRIRDLLPGSPIKDGPLTSWNNGGAGKRLMSLLARGIRAGAPGVRSQLDDVLAAIASPTVTPRLALSAAGTDLRAAATGGNTYLAVTLEVSPGVTGAQVGADFVRYVRDYERTSGRKVLAG